MAMRSSVESADHSNSMPETHRVLRDFFLNHCAPPVCQTPIMEDQEVVSASGRVHYIQVVDCMKLLSAAPDLGTALFNDTRPLLALLQEVCVVLCLETSQVELRPGDVSIRLTHLPPTGVPLPTLPPSAGQLTQVCGSIVRMTTKRVVPFLSRLMCPRCHATLEVRSDPFDRGAAPRQTCGHTACKGEPLQEVSKVWMDYAECRLQQRSNQTGRLPRTVLVTLDDELATKCTVGQFVEVVGVIFPKWKHTFPLSRPSIEPTLWAVNVLPMEAYRGAATTHRPSAATAPLPRRRPAREATKFVPESFYLQHDRDKYGRNGALVLSVCPQLAGLFAPRMSVLLATLGGASTAGKTSMHVRSTIHCLYVGDPSTGKSQLLQCAAQLAPRSTSTTGMGSTSAGLTVAATKENGEWVLEPGALVLSDGGACVIDELRTVSPADRASLHEAMEQQTISVAKGGMVTKLRTACAVISACNPPTRQNGRTEIGVGGPLLSRFDFIYLLWDTPSPRTDEQIAEHVLSCSVAAQQPEPPLQTEELARYLWWVQGQFVRRDGPLLSDRAAALLGTYYNIQRERGGSASLDDAVPVTVRLLESLVRITQAYGKLHLQTTCSVEDAAMAVFLMERSAHALKVPLYRLGPNIFSNSAVLEDVFLDTSPAGVDAQRQVLAALVEVVEHYGSGRAPPRPDDAYSVSLWEEEGDDEDDEEGEGTAGASPGKPRTLFDMRRRARAEDIRAGTIAILPSDVRRSISQLTHHVQAPAGRPRSVSCYRDGMIAGGADAPSLSPQDLLDMHRRSSNGSSARGSQAAEPNQSRRAAAPPPPPQRPMPTHHAGSAPRELDEEDDETAALELLEAPLVPARADTQPPDAPSSSSAPSSASSPQTTGLQKGAGRPCRSAEEIMNSLRHNFL